jgi:hypothetical protein
MPLQLQSSTIPTRPHISSSTLPANARLQKAQLVFIPTFKENLRLCGFNTYAEHRFPVWYLISVQLTFEKDEEIDQRRGEGGKGIIRRRKRRMHGDMDIRGSSVSTGKVRGQFQKTRMGESHHKN